MIEEVSNRLRRVVVGGGLFPFRMGDGDPLGFFDEDDFGDEFDNDDDFGDEFTREPRSIPRPQPKPKKKSRKKR